MYDIHVLVSFFSLRSLCVCVLKGIFELRVRYWNSWLKSDKYNSAHYIFGVKHAIHSQFNTAVHYIRVSSLVEAKEKTWKKADKKNRFHFIIQFKVLHKNRNRSVRISSRKKMNHDDAAVQSIPSKRNKRSRRWGEKMIRMLLSLNEMKNDARQSEIVEKWCTNWKLPYREREREISKSTPLPPTPSLSPSYKCSYVRYTNDKQHRKHEKRWSSTATITENWFLPRINRFHLCALELSVCQWVVSFCIFTSRTKTCYASE